MSGRRKRGQGEGSVFERSDGRWSAALGVGGGRRVYVYGATAAEAREKLQALRQGLKDGLPLPSDRLKFSRFAADWLESVRPSIRPKTALHYGFLLERYAIPRLGDIPLARIQPSHLERLYAEMMGKGLSPKTTRHVHAVLHAALEKAVRWNMVPRNVAHLADAPRLAQKELPVLSPAQARSLLAAAEGHRLEGLFVLALTTGARSAELLGLRWRDLDLEAGQAHIRVALEQVSGTFAIAELKTKGSRRTIALSRVAAESLRRHRARQAEEALQLGPAWQNDWDLVFTTAVGSPLDRHNVLRRDFRPLLRRAGLPENLTFHSLRHIAASLALANGVALPVLSRSLGHSDMSTTLRVYAHVVPGSERQVATAFDAMLAGAAG